MTDPPDVDDDILDHVQGSMVGMALGDALGAPVEFRPRQYLKEHPVRDLVGGGTCGLKKGQFTRVTSMALCLASSLVIYRDFIPYDQLVRYKWWYKYGYMSSTGQCFDIGEATKQSLREFERRQRQFAAQHQIRLEHLDHLPHPHLLDQFDVYCSGDGVAGNGALMRLAPVPLFFHKDPIQAVKFSGISGVITHGDRKAYDACRLVKKYLQKISAEEINQIEPNGSTALHVAAYRGHEDIVELLLQKGACYTTINKYNCTPLDESKTDKIKQMIRRRMNKTRFVGDYIEWILPTDKADFQAHQYWKKLEAYGRDPKFYKLIDYIKRNYIEKDLQHIEDINTVKKYFEIAINKRDPVYLLQAYTAETGFYSALNVHLTQLRLENLTDNENLSRAYYIGIIARHPKFETFSYTGKAFRGMMITNNDLKQYEIGARILTKTFSSSSKQLNIALRFLSDNPHDDNRLSTICIYEVRNPRTALDIQHISLFQYEEEVLILPYSAFKIIDIQMHKDKSPNVEIKLKECEPW
ncbi:unnamed protein product [Rotaria sp. Silwood2]|nr:unnamed protein product [Rotaria sp. Silwood2]